MGSGVGEELDEKATSKAQQRFMGMVHAAQKGALENPSGKVAKVAKSMDYGNVKDFASTKHKGLPEIVKEEEEQPAPESLKKIDSAQAKQLFDSGKYVYIQDDNSPILSSDRNIFSLSKDTWDGSMNIYKQNMTPEQYGFDNIIAWLKEKGAQNIAFYTYNSSKPWIIDEIRTSDLTESIIDQQDPSMVNGNPSSMVKPDMGGDAVASSAPSDSSSSSSSSSMFETYTGQGKHATASDKNQLKTFGKSKKSAEGKQTDDKFEKGVNKPITKPSATKSGNKLKDFGDETSEKAKGEKVNEPIVSIKETLDKELAFYAKHLNQLNTMISEDRKPSALVTLDRLKKDNEENFKSDLKNNNIEDAVDMQNELMANELTTEVGDNPYKLGQEIEKKALAKTDGGKSFKNVGDSTNDKGDEIPKRNLTKEEMVAVAMNRGKGLQDFVFDNEPSKRFEERMKKDMGEDIYKLRNQKMDYEANAPMYNKDTQPQEKGEKAIQYDKDRSGYNSTKGIGESISAKYFDDLGKKKFVDFKINEAVEIESVDETFVKLSTEGMGNSYTTKVNENVTYNDFAAKYDFYLKESVVYVSKKKQSLNESVENKPKTFGNMDKMNHLIGYKPATFVDSKKSKK
ncbi:MAG: DUF3008 family protein [Richelia sp. RM2_1_2]|nr:DUF3008 family protein [Richelia sp. RM2_1_2]